MGLLYSREEFFKGKGKLSRSTLRNNTGKHVI